jgi:hypothetical protein
MMLHEGDPDYFNQGQALFVLSVSLWHALLSNGPVRHIAEQIVLRCYNQAMVERGVLKYNKQLTEIYSVIFL